MLKLMIEHEEAVLSILNDSLNHYGIDKRLTEVRISDVMHTLKLLQDIKIELQKIIANQEPRTAGYTQFLVKDIQKLIGG